MKKKIAIIGTVGIPAKYGGFETLTEYLTKFTSEKFEITVFCSLKSSSERIEKYNGVNLEYINLKANGIQSIPYDIISILRSLKIADTLLILGVSGCVILPLVKLFCNKKIIVNIDGLEWKRDKWGWAAKWFLKFSEKQAVKFADIIVCDNKVIQSYVNDEYSVTSQLIAYGADHVTKEVLSEELKIEFPFLQSKYAFKVCRIEPENNIHLILDAFREFKKLNIVLIGNWSNSSYGKSLKEEYDNIDNIYLFDPIYDQKKLNKLRSNCYIYIHGHSAGGTNPSLVEAMYLELPIIAFGINYNKETTNNKSLYFDNKFELIQILSTINEAELNEMAKEMKKLANSKYTWELVSKKYSELF